jgi:hypothetical protein
MLIYLMRVETEGGLRYVGNPEKWVTLTLHPCSAQRFDMNKPLPRSAADAVDKYGVGTFVIVNEAACLSPACDCTWQSERPNLRAQ